jgi:acyl carrier protein
MDGEQTGLFANLTSYGLTWKDSNMGLDTVEFVLWAEKEFQIEIPDKDAETIYTVGHFSTYVHQKLTLKLGLKVPSEQFIFNRIKEYIASEFKIAPDSIQRESRFINDLGFD